VAVGTPKEPDATPYVDPVIEFYKTKIDRTVLRENLKLTVQQRLDKMIQRMNELESSGLAS
jgi:hypothetical protein